MTGDNPNAAMVAKPTRWQRIKWWSRWPWAIKFLDPSKIEFNQDWVTVFRQEGYIIGVSRDDHMPRGFQLAPDRWTCLRGLVTGRLWFETEITPPQGNTGTDSGL